MEYKLFISSFIAWMNFIQVLKSSSQYINMHVRLFCDSKLTIGTSRLWLFVCHVPVTSTYWQHEKKKMKCGLTQQLHNILLNLDLQSYVSALQKTLSSFLLLFINNTGGLFALDSYSVTYLHVFKFLKAQNAPVCIHNIKWQEKSERFITCSSNREVIDLKNVHLNQCFSLAIHPQTVVTVRESTANLISNHSSLWLVVWSIA